MAQATLTPQLFAVGRRRPRVPPPAAGPLHPGDEVTLDLGTGWALVCLTEVRGQLLSGIVTRLAGKSSMAVGDRVRVTTGEVYAVESIGEPS